MDKVKGTVIICYDIACDRRRERIARVLHGYGERVLESVFEWRLDAATLMALRARLAKIVAAEDKLGYWQICGHDFKDRYSQGKQVFEPEADYFIY